MRKRRRGVFDEDNLRGAGGDETWVSGCCSVRFKSGLGGQKDGIWVWLLAWIGFGAGGGNHGYLDGLSRGCGFIDGVLVDRGALPSILEDEPSFF